MLIIKSVHNYIFILWIAIMLCMVIFKICIDNHTEKGNCTFILWNIFRTNAGKSRSNELCINILLNRIFNVRFTGLVPLKKSWPKKYFLFEQRVKPLEIMEVWLYKSSSELFLREFILLVRCFHIRSHRRWIQM